MKLLLFLFAFHGLSQSVEQKSKYPTCSTCEFYSHKGTYQRCVQNGTIHLTFDDGPLPKNTNRVLDLLKVHNISATFFINGANYSPDIDEPETRATIRRAIKEGHRIAHHTWSHKSLTSQPVSVIVSEMERLSDKLEEVFGFRPVLMRPPFGHFNDTVVEIVRGQLGYEMIMWSICPCDWARDIQYSLNVYKEKLERTDPSQTPGFISLHHDPINISVEFATLVIEYVKITGYRFVGLEECLGF